MVVDLSSLQSVHADKEKETNCRERNETTLMLVVVVII